MCTYTQHQSKRTKPFVKRGKKVTQKVGRGGKFKVTDIQLFWYSSPAHSISKHLKGRFEEACSSVKVSHTFIFSFLRPSLMGIWGGGYIYLGGDLGEVQAGLEVWQIVAIFTVSLALHSLRCYLYSCTVLSLAEKPCTVSACISSLPP